MTRQEICREAMQLVGCRRPSDPMPTAAELNFMLPILDRLMDVSMDDLAARLAVEIAPQYHPVFHL